MISLSSRYHYLQAFIVLGLCSQAQAQPYDSATFERVLVPISTNAAPGVYGTSWSTELWYRNNSSFPVAVLPTVEGDYVPSIGIMGPLRIPRRPPETPGEFLYITRGYVDQVQFDLRLDNRADLSDDFGTKLPVVREAEFSGRIGLINVPTDGTFRIALRIYGLSEDATSAAVRVLSDLNAPLASVDIPLGGSPPYAEILMLADRFPAVRTKNRVRIDIEANHGARLWAFVTITSNVTQHVSVITP